MAWIKTVPFDEADEKLRKILLETRAAYPAEYALPAPSASPTGESIIDSHTLMPDALYHSFMAFGAMMADDLPLARRQHELIATLVSTTNACFY